MNANEKIGNDEALKLTPLCVTISRRISGFKGDLISRGRMDCRWCYVSNKEHISCIQFSLFSFKERQEFVKVLVDQQFFTARWIALNSCFFLDFLLEIL